MSPLEFMVLETSTALLAWICDKRGCVEGETKNGNDSTQRHWQRVSPKLLYRRYFHPLFAIAILLTMKKLQNAEQNAG
jgi:hypothetical protein